MAELGQSLIILGELIGLLNEDGTVQWQWFGNPKTQVLAMGARRKFLKELIRSLKGDDPNTADVNFTAGYSWVPLNDGKIEVGFVWSTEGDLQIGFGSQANFTPVNMSVLANLFEIGEGGVTPTIKNVMFSGKLPAPGFLESIELDGQTAPPSVTAQITNKQTGTSAVRKLIYQSSTVPSVFAWDCARIAYFVLEAWIHDRAANAGGNALFTRIDQHAFPMLGDPPSAIQEFPLVGLDNMQKEAEFGPWINSVLNLGGGATGGLVFLRHLRALLTGNENPDFLTGSPSLFMPLVAGSTGGTPPTASGQAIGSYNPATVTTAGVWIGILDNSPSDTLVMDIQSGTAGKFLRIPLAQVSGGKFTPPPPPTAHPPSADLQTFLSDLPVNSGLKAAKGADGLWTVSFPATLSDQSLPASVLNGEYHLSAVLATPIKIQVSSTQLPVAFPPEAVPPAQLIGTLVNWIVSAVPPGSSPSDPQTQITNIAKELAGFISTEIRTPGSGDISQLLLSICEALPGGASFDKKSPPFDFTLSLSKGNDPFYHIKPTVTYGPITPDQVPDLPISIGNLSASLDLAINPPNNPLHGFSLGIDDLRIGVIEGDGLGGVSDLISSLVPDLKQAKGFTLGFDWTETGGVKLSGGGKIPVQLTLGPLNLSQLLVDVNNTSLTIGANVSFQLSFITVNTYDLGISYDFQSGAPSLSLQGLGLSFDGAGISLSGMFLKDNGDYIGCAAVSVESLFSLSAIGGYEKLAGGQASLFIFASLRAPLGGPPFFFVTGVAGGFGYNRMLPPVTLMSNHPFFTIMSGKPISTDPKVGLSALTDPRTGFAPKLGDYWIAAGLQFTSFGFINGKVIVSVAFGHDFSINILGMASFGIQPAAYFEIDIALTVDSEKFMLIAGVSPASYLIHPDIFNLSGDFGLAAWHSGPHQGDFLLSIGGYHPYFRKPDYYPDLARVSVRANVFGFVHLAVECFFACTPQALMAGASVSLSATFAGIGAGLDVYVDVFIQWDPFFIRADMGVHLWFEFCGRHEIGVDLTIQTPPFGGHAHISLFIVSFDVSFGDSQDRAHSYLALADFFTKHLNVPAIESPMANDANVAKFNTDSAAGLIRVLFTSGKTLQDTADRQTEQEGTNSPVQVAPEFSFLVRTRLPFNLHGPVGAYVTGNVHLPLCGKGDLSTDFSVSLVNDSNGNAVPIPGADISATYGQYPLANFGPTPHVAQADNDPARTAVAGIDTSQPAIQLLDGLQFNLQPTPSPTINTLLTGLEEQPSDSTESYPLPLSWPPSVSPQYRMPVSKLSYLTNAASTAAINKNALQILPKPQTTKIPGQFHLPIFSPGLIAAGAAAAAGIVSTSAPVNRPMRLTAAQVSLVAGPPSGVTAMTPPASPVRRIELAPVTLRVLPARTPVASVTTSVLRPIQIALPKALRSVLATRAAIPPVAAAATPVPGATAVSLKPTVTVVSGHAVHLAISSGAQAPQGSLIFAGSQTVRAIFMTAFGEPVADQYVVDNQTVQLPARTRNVLLIGEGALTGAPVSLGNIGAEPGTSLYVIGPKEYASHGCVVRSNAPLLQTIAPGQTVTGADVLPKSSSFSFYFPPAPKGSSLLITLTPGVANPAPAATQMRWRATGATLSTLSSAANATYGALVMDAQASEAWQFNIDLTVEWRLAGIVVCTQTSANVLTHLQNNSNWTLIDDRFLQPPSPMSTTVTIGVTSG